MLARLAPAAIAAMLWLAPAAPAQAAAWSPPQTLARGQAFRSSVSAATSPSGRAAVGWLQSGRLGLSFAAPRGPWSRPMRLLQGSASETQIALVGRDRAIALLELDRGSAEREAIAVVDATRDRGFGRLRTLVPSAKRLGDLHMLAAPSGDALATWFHADVIRVAAGPRGGPLGAPVAVTRRDAFQHAAAMDDRGNAAVVWGTGNGIVFAAFRPAGGAFQAPQQLSAPGGFSRDADVAFDAAGNAIAVWAQSSGGRYRIQSASRPAGGEAFGAPVPVSGSDQDAQVPAVAGGRAGEAIAAYVADPGRLRAVRRTSVAGGFGEPIALFPRADLGSEPLIGADRRGGAVIAWAPRAGRSFRRELRAITARGGRFGRATRVSAPGEDVNVNVASPRSLAVGPRGDALLAWVTDRAARVARLPGTRLGD